LLKKYCWILNRPYRGNSRKIQCIPVIRTDLRNVNVKRITHYENIYNGMITITLKIQLKGGTLFRIPCTR